jgi:hypothetical protein
MTPKISKGAASYRPATEEEQRCGKCSMYVRGGGCTLVKGAINSHYTCDHWEPKHG